MSHADFDYRIEENKLLIVDLDLGNKSVTNDIEYVLNFIRSVEGDKILDLEIQYCGSDEVWCKVKPIWLNGKCIKVEFIIAS